MFAGSGLLRRLAAPLGLAFALTCGLLSAPASAQIPYSQLSTPQTKYAAIVIDANSGEILYEKNADDPRYPASVTKVMTLYLTFEALNDGRLRLTDRVPFSAHASSRAPTKLGLKAGDSITVDQAIKALAVKSANDAASALAEKIGGTEASFASLMTLRARELGMRNTRFVNPHGLPDPRQITTARDLAILSRAVMRDYPQYYRYFALKSFEFRGQTIMGHKRLLSTMPGFDGLKTGYTNASGFNLAGSATRDGRRLISVVMGGPTAVWRDNNMQMLLTAGFDAMDRRRMGERTVIAGNLFQDPTNEDYAQARYAANDEDDDGPADDGGPGVPSPDGRMYARVDSDGPAYGGEAYTASSSYAPQGDNNAARAFARLRPTQSAAPARSERGDVAFTSGPPRAAPMRVESSFDRARQAPSGGRWAIQVGAFDSRGLASQQVSLVKRRFPRAIGGSQSAIEVADSGAFRAQFRGLSAEDARAACSTISAGRQPCMVVAPR